MYDSAIVKTQKKVQFISTTVLVRRHDAERIKPSLRKRAAQDESCSPKQLSILREQQGSGPRNFRNRAARISPPKCLLPIARQRQFMRVVKLFELG
jgi:hypothetical protein